MGRSLIKVVLILGVIFGLASGCAGVHHHRWHHGAWSGSWHGHHRAEFEKHVAELCTEAALNTQRKSTQP